MAGKAIATDVINSRWPAGSDAWETHTYLLSSNSSLDFVSLCVSMCHRMLRCCLFVCLRYRIMYRREWYWTDVCVCVIHMIYLHMLWTGGFVCVFKQRHGRWQCNHRCDEEWYVYIYYIVCPIDTTLLQWRHTVCRESLLHGQCKPSSGWPLVMVAF